MAKLGVEIRKGSFFLEEDHLGKILNETVDEDLKKIAEFTKRLSLEVKNY